MKKTQATAERMMPKFVQDRCGWKFWAFHQFWAQIEQSIISTLGISLSHFLALQMILNYCYMSTESYSNACSQHVIPYCFLILKKLCRFSKRIWILFSFQFIVTSVKVISKWILVSLENRFNSIQIRPLFDCFD